MSLIKDEMSSVMKGSFGLVGEFKQFISRGNVVDLAVGVIIGGAFGAITTSLVKDVVMPPISCVDVSSWKYMIAHPVTDITGKVTQPEVDLTYGNFLQATLNFLIVAAVIFLVIKLINTMKRKEAEAPSAPPAPSAEEKLLTEIRDLLAKKT
jgi:large conductance mechanosensitive channel